MKEELIVAAIQLDLLWEDIDGNLTKFESEINKLTEADVILLPELFSTGFSMDAIRLAETMDGNTVMWMKKMAMKSKAALGGSTVIKENGEVFNRFLWVHPNGDIEYYDKRHLFTLAREESFFKAGSSREIFEYQGWKILPQVCYDLRFPVFARNRFIEGQAEYDLIIYVASWPDIRSFAWESLLTARAIENQAYCIGVNRVGEDPTGHTYKGMTAAYDALGEKIGTTMPKKEQTLITKLSAQKLNAVRRKIPFLPDQDQFTFLP